MADTKPDCGKIIFDKLQTFKAWPFCPGGLSQLNRFIGVRHLYMGDILYTMSTDLIYKAESTEACLMS